MSFVQKMSGQKLLDKLVQTVLSQLQDGCISKQESKSQIQEIIQQIEEEFQKCLQSHQTQSGLKKQAQSETEGDMDMADQEELKHDVKMLEKQVEEQQQILTNLLPQVRKFADVLRITELDPQKYQ
eukprot:TRINITY_DN1558_c0_g3_i1.p1 TRINITY_DN1558_c0_g3~~TRINITY_DN1558_c0_g3_i1.p1  ORF type:complete len:148 (-),score=19.32 TRINITY_DN1558_c0_g3_i1:485-862(-)